MQDCLNLQPTAGNKLEQINYLQFPPVFIDTYTENQAPIAREDFFFLYQNETLDGNVLYNDADWNAETFSVVSVNGEAGNVGIELTLDDGGATCTIEANGALHFVPGPDYDLDVDESRTLTLTYEVSDGTDVTEGTIKIVVWGIYVAPSPEPPVGDYMLLIAPDQTDTTIIERTGKAVESFGDITVAGGLIEMNGGYFVVGEPGDFDLLVNCQQSWTLEILFEVDTMEVRIISLCATANSSFSVVASSASMPINVEIATGGLPIIFGSSFESFALQPGINHVALVFDATAVENGVRYFANGEYVGYFAYETGGVFGSDTGSTLMFGHTSGDSMIGTFAGIRLSDSVVYAGTASFTPPTEF